MFEANVFKSIDRFQKYAKEQRTSFASIAKAYKAANKAAAGSQETFLITSSTDPTLSRSDRYAVHTAPCGWGPRVCSEKVHRPLLMLAVISNHPENVWLVFCR